MFFNAAPKKKKKKKKKKKSKLENRMRTERDELLESI